MNVSHIKTHLECPTKAFYIHTLHREPHRRPVALQIGTCWHLAMEGYLRSPTKDKLAGLAAVAQYLVSSPEDPKVVSGWNAIEPAFLAWSWPDEWELLAVEQLIEHKFTSYLTFQGRLDGLVKWNNQYWHLQHKTLSPSTPLHVYAAFIQRDWHECWYEWACRNSGYTPFGGTILNVVRKLSARTIQADPSAAISVQYIPRPAHVVSKAVEDLQIIGGQILYNIGTHIQNRSSCAGHFGNSLCPYIDVCNNVASIDDDALFTTVADRYATPDIPLSSLE